MVHGRSKPRPSQWSHKMTEFTTMEWESGEVSGAASPCLWRDIFTLLLPSAPSLSSEVHAIASWFPQEPWVRVNLLSRS